MGFGLMLVGFTMLLCFSAFDALPAFIGYFICVYALLKLSEYETGFKFTSFIYGAVGVYFLTRSVMEWVILLEGNTVLSDFSQKLNMADEVLFYFGQLALLPPLIAILKNTGRKKTLFACRRNAVLFVLFFLLWIAANLCIAKGSPHASKWAAYIMASRYLVMLLNMISLFSSYMWICPEGEEELEPVERKITAGVTKAFQKEKSEKQEEQLPASFEKKKRKK